MMINKSMSIKYIRDKLTTGGYKFTEQRLQIIKAICENNRHMNADEIYRKVKIHNIGISTVYRNLTILEEVGVLKKINVSNICYYELEGFGDDNVDVHAKCIKCNKIIDIDEVESSGNLHDFIENLREKHNITVKSSSIILSVVCKECKMKI